MNDIVGKWILQAGAVVPSNPALNPPPKLVVVQPIKHFAVIFAPYVVTPCIPIPHEPLVLGFDTIIGHILPIDWITSIELGKILTLSPVPTG